MRRNCELSVRNMLAKKKDLLSSAMKRTSEWFFILFFLDCFVSQSIFISSSEVKILSIIYDKSLKFNLYYIVSGFLPRRSLVMSPFM